MPGPPAPPAPTGPFNPTRSHLDPAYVPVAWAASQAAGGLQGQGVKVGILDTGAQAGNPGLAGRIGSYKNYVAGADTSTQDKYGHGTQVAQILGGTATPLGSGGNPFPGGVAPASTLYVARVIGDDGASSLQYVQPAYADLLAQGVRLFNNSYGQTASINTVAGQQNNANSALVTESRWYQPAVDAGGLLVWAAGNEGQRQPSIEGGLPSLMPGLEKGWLTVVNVALDGRGAVTGLDATSNACGVAAAWCLAAPGTDYYSPVTGTAFATGAGNGTSLSAAIVTGTAALVWQQFPWMSGSNVQQTLLGTATALGDPAIYGYGLVNAAKAVNGPGRFDWGTFTASVPVATSSTFANNIAGAGGLLKMGNGSLTLAGASTYAGGTTVSQGTLTLAGSVASDVTVNAMGQLWGRGGVINANLTNSGTAGTRDGSLQVTGDYVASAMSTTVVNLGDPLRVSGTASLNNGEVKIVYGSGYAARSVEPLLIAAGGLDGSFGFLTLTGSVFVSGDLSYTPTEADITLSRASVSSVAIASYAASDHTTQQTAQHIDAALQQADLYPAASTPAQADFTAAADAFIHASSLPVAKASIDSLSGQIHASSQALTFQQAGIVDRTLANRIDGLAGGNEGGVWFQGTGANGSIARAGYASGSYTGGGAAAGYDHAIADGGVLGAALDWNRLGSHYAAQTGTSSTRSTGVSLYGGAVFGNAYASGRVGQGWIHSDIGRWALLGGGQAAISSVRADRLSSFYGETGYRFVGTDTVLTPFLGLGYDHLERGAIAERGAGGFGLLADQENYDQSHAQLGARLARDWRWSGGSASLSGYVLYQRLLGSANLGFEAAYAGAPGATFTVQGIDPARHGVWAGIGLTTRLASGWSWYANLDGQFATSGSRSRAISAGLRKSF